MRKYSIFNYLSLLLLIGFIYACSGSNAPESKNQKQYSRIDKKVKETNLNLSSYRDMMETLDDGGLLTAYYDNGYLKKIHVENFIEGGARNRFYYFDKGFLLYLEDRINYLDMPDPKEGIITDIYYFEGTNMIGWKKNGKNEITEVKGANFETKQREIWNNLDDYLILIQ